MNEPTVGTDVWRLSTDPHGLLSRSCTLADPAAIPDAIPEAIPAEVIKLLNASVVFFTRTFNEPMRRKLAVSFSIVSRSFIIFVRYSLCNVIQSPSMN